jgi:hypothetical protein
MSRSCASERTNAILRRLLAYARARLGWEAGLDALSDTRRRPRILTPVIVRSLTVMFLTRLGSLNALLQTRPQRFWSGWLGAAMPSADTLGRVATQIEVSGLREVHQQVYTRLKRGKALPPPAHGLIAGVIDGHESHATFRRHCTGCLSRTIHTAAGDRTQYYHRHVTFQLVGDAWALLLDAEAQRPGEDEVAAALRLLERVLAAYPRAFEVVLGDALYADPRIFNYLYSRGKDILTVLKGNHPALLEDAGSLFETMSPVGGRNGTRVCQWWDLSGFTTWPQVAAPIRIVRSVEDWTVRRQLDGQKEQQHTEWFWVTTLDAARATTATVVQLGHARWSIENEGFNELATRWHADHVYRHESAALLVFTLLAMLCLNVFQAFYRRDLKPAARAAGSRLHVARQAAAELHASPRAATPRAPPGRKRPPPVHPLA